MAVATTEATPTLHIADPGLAKMIEESQATMLMHTTTNKVNVDFNGKHDLGIELLTNNLGVLRNASDNNLVWILTSDQDHGENYDGKKLELVCGDTVSHRGKLSSPGNTK